MNLLISYLFPSVDSEVFMQVLHFIHRKTEAQREEAICLRSANILIAELEI